MSDDYRLAAGLLIQRELADNERLRKERDQLAAEVIRLREGLAAMANELSWNKKTRDISDRIRAMLKGWPL